MSSPFQKKFCGKTPDPIKMLGDLNKDGKMSSYEQTRQDAIEANSPNNYGSPLNQFQENASKDKTSSVDVVQRSTIKNPNFKDLTQKQKDSLHKKAMKLGKKFYSKELKVEVDPEDGVLSRMPNPNYKK
jgi:hypothetical protein